MAKSELFLKVCEEKLSCVSSHRHRVPMRMFWSLIWPMLMMTMILKRGIIKSLTLALTTWNHNNRTCFSIYLCLYSYNLNMHLLNQICVLDVLLCYVFIMISNEWVKVSWPQRWFWSSVCTARVHISPPAGSCSTHPSECPSLLTPGTVVRDLRKHLLI